ncbi:MAG: hypothetical protein P4L68_04900 [Methylovirgula sp.]|nr:hypothetical protein [Methylovirgula sp.]
MSENAANAAKLHQFAVIAQKTLKFYLLGVVKISMRDGKQFIGPLNGLRAYGSAGEVRIATSAGDKWLDFGDIDDIVEA